MAPHGSKSTFDKTDFDPFSGARLLVFSKKKKDLGFMGRKRRIGDELEVLKTRQMILVGFPGFSGGQIIQT